MVPVEGGATGPLRRCSSDECVGEAGWERAVSSGECWGGGEVRETSCLSTYTSVQTLCLPRPDASKSRKSIRALVELNESSRRTGISGASIDAIWCLRPVCLAWCCCPGDKVSSASSLLMKRWKEWHLSLGVFHLNMIYCFDKAWKYYYYYYLNSDILYFFLSPPDLRTV